MKAIGQAGIICRSNLTSSAGPQTQQLHEHECAEYARTIRFRSAGVGWLGWVPRHASIPQLPNINVPNIVFSSLTVTLLTAPPRHPSSNPPIHVLLGKHAGFQGKGCAGQALLAIFCTATKPRSHRMFTPWPPPLH